VKKAVFESHPQPDWPELHKELAKPFPARSVSWRAGVVSRDKRRAQALPFVDPRLYEDRLNRVCPGDWSVHFRPWGEKRIVCELTVYGVTRASTGEFDAGDRIAQGTAAEAQAFKRACSKFGLGRYLYEIPIVWVDYDEGRSRLSETPELSGRFAPSDLEPSALPDAGVTLTSDRAEAMRRELEKLGLARSEQAEFAAAVLGRRIGDFASLTETEALEIWNVARSSGHDIAV
jgi:hypothetical protein